MLLLVQQLLAVVLAVDVQQLLPDPPQLGHGDGPAVDFAEVLAVPRQLPLEQQVAVLVRGSAGLRQPRQAVGHLGELRADKGPVRAGADQVPGGAPSQHRPHGVDDDGLAGAGLAGEGVEARAELDVRLLDDRDILNVQKLQHGGPSSEKSARQVRRARQCQLMNMASPKEKKRYFSRTASS